MNRLEILPCLLLVSVAGTAFCQGIGGYPVTPYSVTGRTFAQVDELGRHLGEDLQATTGVGTPVRAIADGTVVLSKKNRQGYGQYLVINHPSLNVVTLYAHLSRQVQYPLRATGAVKANDIIGYVGSYDENGHVDPHVHFAVYKKLYDGIYHYYGSAPNDRNDDVDVDKDGILIGGLFTKPGKFIDTRLAASSVSHLSGDITDVTLHDSTITITNTGLQGSGDRGSICANVYAFSPSKAIIATCSLLVPANSSVGLSALNDILSNGLTGVRPNNTNVRIVGSQPGLIGQAGSQTYSACDPATVAPETASNPYTAGPGGAGGAVTAGLQVTIAPTGGSPTSLAATALGFDDLGKLTGTAEFVQSNGSSFGICGMRFTGQRLSPSAIRVSFHEGLAFGAPTSAKLGISTQLGNPVTLSGNSAFVAGAFSMPPSAGWLGVSPVSGTGPATLSVAIATNLTTGIYRGQLSVATPGTNKQESIPITAAVAPAGPSPFPSDALQVGNVADLSMGDTGINIANSTNRNICANVYAVQLDGTMAATCSTLVPANSAAFFSANQDFSSNTLTGVRPSSLTVNVIASQPSLASDGQSFSICDSSKVIPQTAAIPYSTQAGGSVTSGLTLSSGNSNANTTPFSTVPLNAVDLSIVTSTANSIRNDGDSFGLCRSAHILYQ